MRSPITKTTLPARKINIVRPPMGQKHPAKVHHDSAIPPNTASSPIPLPESEARQRARRKRAKALAASLAEWKGSTGAFVRHLDRQGVDYLSFSHVSSLEFCPYRYYLEFVRRIRLVPQPDYFIKGRILHEALARYYRGFGRGRVPTPDMLHKFIDRHNRADGSQLKNAITLAIQNVRQGWEVVAVEKPFITDLGGSLPPCLGVVDLILRKNNCYAVVDHKSSRRFTDDDADGLQLEIYRNFVRQSYKAEVCMAFYDEYRWVDDLGRIRKPAFRRVLLEYNLQEWESVLNRLVRAHEEMLAIRKGGRASGSGNCYMCPFKVRCPKASTSRW